MFVAVMLDVGLANELKMAFRRADYEGRQVKSLCEGNILAQVRQVLLGNARIVPIEVVPGNSITQAMKITVPQSLTTLERIALGLYDWVNDSITNEQFPHDLTTVGEWEFDLYFPNCHISSEYAMSQAEVDGWIVAKADHLFAFGQAFPDVQRKFPVIALGSVCCMDGEHLVLALCNGVDERHVRLRDWRGVWGPSSRFLRVRKIKPLVA